MTRRARVESETAKRAYGMTFTDQAFAIFLPVVFALYWLARFKTAQNLVLPAASYSITGSCTSRFVP